MIDVYSVEALCFYLYNRAPLAVIADLFGEVHPSYAGEKLVELQRGFHSLWARLDHKKKRELVEIAQDFADARGFDPTAFER